MAASYLKKQFSIPHHLVPSFGDVSGTVQGEDEDSVEVIRPQDTVNYSFDHR